MTRDELRDFAVALIDEIDAGERMRAELRHLRAYKAEREAADIQSFQQSVGTAFGTLKLLVDRCKQPIN